MFTMLVRISRQRLRSLCREMANEDGAPFDGATYLRYMRSLKPDATGIEWVSFRLKSKIRFEPIFNDFGVSEWMADEPVHELCDPHLLNKLERLLADRGEMISVWRAHYHTSHGFEGDENCDLDLVFLGELDAEKLEVAIKTR